MISYELAKKLKDAGFPQWNYQKKGDVFCRGTDKECYIPTLSELLEACGKGFYALYSPVDLYTPPGEAFGLMAWVAVSPGSEYLPGKVIDFGHKAGAASTPEEAVANLWLALQEPIK